MASENCRFIFDTSTIVSVLGKDSPDCPLDTIEKRKDFLDKSSEFLRKIRGYIASRHNLLTTTFVLEELLSRKTYHYKKSIKKEGQCGDRNLLNLRRAIKENERERRRVANAFNDNQRILVLNDGMRRIYDEKSAEYSALREKYGLSETDFDLLIKGMALAMASKPAVLVSNDFKIFHARNEIIKDNFGNKPYLIRYAGFLVRRDYFRFERLKFFP
jgi:hypothetical protein